MNCSALLGRRAFQLKQNRRLHGADLQIGLDTAGKREKLRDGHVTVVSAHGNVRQRFGERRVERELARIDHSGHHCGRHPLGARGQSETVVERDLVRFSHVPHAGDALGDELLSAHQSRRDAGHAVLFTNGLQIGMQIGELAILANCLPGNDEAHTGQGQKTAAIHVSPRKKVQSRWKTAKTVSIHQLPPLRRSCIVCLDARPIFEDPTFPARGLEIMGNHESLIHELARYALSKQGVRQQPGSLLPGPLEEPVIQVRFASSWRTFFELHKEMDLDSDGRWFEKYRRFRMPVGSDALARHLARYPAICEADWAERDGHAYLESPPDADIPLEYWKSLIDDAYSLIWNKLDDNGRRLVELSEQPYDERAMIDRLTELHGLARHRDDIQRFARPAILLRTMASDEKEIPLGPSKIGGRPDLPLATPWPTYRDGRPLAFLAQINMNEIARLPPPFAGLPKDGLLSVFSVWGWQKRGQPRPRDSRRPHLEKPGRLRLDSLLAYAIERRARRREPPEGVNLFCAALAEPEAMLSLPKHRQEPPLAACSSGQRSFWTNTMAWNPIIIRCKCCGAKSWEPRRPKATTCLAGTPSFSRSFPARCSTRDWRWSSKSPPTNMRACAGATGAN